MQDRWFYGWNILALTLVVQATAYGILIYSFALFVVPWQKEFGISLTSTMACMVSLQVVMGFMSPFAGQIFDKYSLRYLMMLGGFLLAVGLLLMSQVSTYWQLLLLFATILPAGLALTGPLAAQTLVTRWFTNRRGLVLGISAMGTSIGGLIFPLLNEMLISTSGWRQTIIILAAINLPCICGLSYFVLKREPPKIEHTLQHDQTHRPSNNKRWTTAEIFTNSMFWIPVVSIIFIVTSYGSIQYNLGAYMEDINFESEQTAILISLAAVSMIFGKLFFGSLSDKLDHRLLFCIAAIGLGIALVLFQIRVDLTTLRIAAIVLGFSIASVLPLAAIIISSRFGIASFGKVMGFVTLFMTLGSFGSMITGILRDKGLEFSTIFIMMAGLMIVPVVAMCFLKPPIKE